MFPTLESRIIVPPPLVVNFSIFFHPGHLYSNPPVINFQSFLLTFSSVNSHFHHVHHKEKEIVQSSTITSSELRKHETCSTHCVIRNHNFLVFWYDIVQGICACLLKKIIITMYIPPPPIIPTLPIIQHSTAIIQSTRSGEKDLIVT